MANLLNITAKVLGIIGNRIDGDATLLIDQHITNALNNVCKFVAENKPTGHEKLLLSQSNTTIHAPAADYEYNFFLLSEFTYPIVVTRQEFHRLDLVLDDVYQRGHRVNSMPALSLSEAHGQFYYYPEMDRIYVNTTEADIPDITGLGLTHYIYANITQFPEVLESYLIDELVKLIQNEPAKKMEEKNEV